jgi:ribulose-phosphate 3-epimerase
VPVEIAPSILTADFANLERELGRIASADWVHLDVMDGHFVPNLSIGLPVIRRLAAISPLPTDVHLMIDNPDAFAPGYAGAGVDSVTFHLEAARAPVRLARAIRGEGARAAVAINPATPVAALENLLEEVDMILIMSVEPGFGGQSFIERSLAKLAQAKALIADRPIRLQIDGGADRRTIGRIARAGADLIVAGSAVFGAEDPAAEIRALREAAR